jgi:hypothetical protein
LKGNGKENGESERTEGAEQMGMEEDGKEVGHTGGGFGFMAIRE